MSVLFDNKYRFVKNLGSGGFGKVFLAREEHAGSFVAIKQLINEDKRRQHNIIYEMQMVSKFNHPNIVLYKHHFVQDDLLYIVMEYCPLGSLRDRMHQEEISSAQVWQWMDELTKTLQLVHEKEIIHHDIKPDNILFTENRTIKITDFGVANTGGGTLPYMSPEPPGSDIQVDNDPRADIYALGVTLLELLTRQNPFFGMSAEEIAEIHDMKDFGITGLPNWQQEIILKAIAKFPEQRFQSMKDFNEAIQAQSVPVIFDKEVIQAGELAEKAARLLERKKWQSAFSVLEYAEKTYKPNINVLLQKGKYHLMAQEIELSKTYYEKALKWNPRLDVQKELGCLNLALKNYPTAISLLSDHVHRNPSDFEAYNLLLQCYYETNRYEPAMDLARTLLEIEPANKCFANNYYVCSAMFHIGKTVFPHTVLKADKSENHFLNYNYGVILETQQTHHYKNRPTLKSKLLFMDYRFNQYSPSTLFCTASNLESMKETETQKAIIKFGREGIMVNDVKIPDGRSISRRHCLIINFKDDIWLHDLDSTGTILNGFRVVNKAPLIGRNKVRIFKTEFEFTNDKSRLF
jgi:serine/threonine protein kinase